MSVVGCSSLLACPVPGAGSPLLQALRGSGACRLLSPGDALWHAGERPDRVALLCQGLVLMRSRDPGCERATGIERPGAVLGMDPSFWMDARVTDVVAITPVVAHVVEGEAVRRLLAEGGALALAAARVFAEGCALGVGGPGAGGAAALYERLARLLCVFLDACGVAEPPGAFAPVRLSRDELAQLVGASPGATDRALATPPIAGTVRHLPDGFYVHDAPLIRAVAATCHG